MLAALLSALKLSVRGKLPHLAFVFVLFLGATVLLAAEFSGRQPATVAMDVGLSIIRAAIPLLIVFLAQDLVTNEFEHRYFLISMTYPKSRTDWLLGRFLAIVGFTFVALAVMALVLVGLTYFIQKGYGQATPVSLGEGFVWVIAFIAVDLFVIASCALVFSVFAKSPSFVVAGTLGFMLIARSFSTVLNLIHEKSGLVRNEESYVASLGTLFYLIPDLGALDVRAIALYGKLEFLPRDWPFLMIGSIAYSLVLVLLATWAIRRRSLA